ncbi:OmpA family protein [Hymenobacter sp. BRD128]|uniref:PA14 domain-containing protein n=1 Tax=Hymenobacter sp. BRD128 TaxID=2675878 RepID=UPI00156499A0|nr:PA14 domain-containing protein [Hymenobacter sp. BRD128]QKG57166.1 OmpA family protein [Hymenobacter sp. BRD128]
MKRFFSNLLFGSLASAVPLLALAQAGVAREQAALGDGLRGDYYSGLNFEHLIKTRRDALIDFNWSHEPPLPGVPAEEFTVRWTGWLVPPTTGHYVLHLAIDDGARLWLDGKQLLDEWRGQPLGYYSVPVDLQAGRPYRLRLDYCQYSLDTRALLLWERPRQPEKLLVSSWRNLWGMTEKVPTFASRLQETIPTRYLFSHVPGPPRLAVDLTMVAVVASKPPFTSVLASDPSRPTPTTWYAINRARPKAEATRPLAKRKQPPKAVASAQSADRLADQLLHGQSLTLRTLYFEQGRAELPTTVRASLDTLARVLRRYPALRLEVQGHTDNQGDPLLNQQLSMRRAEAVCQYLTSLGVPETRLRPLGLGGTQPVADNNQPTERPRNRRVVLRPLPPATAQP